MEEGKQEIVIQGKEHELVPLHTDLETPDKERGDISFVAELRHNKDTRRKVILSLSIALSYMLLGWTKGQLGPAFLDIMFISGADIGKGSGFMTSYYAGRLLGAVMAGAVYSKINTYLMFVISISVNGVIVAAIPWCSYYELMIAAHILHGTSGGVLDVATVTEGVAVWGPSARGRSYLQILSASFSISGILAPIATAPFLLQTHTNVSSGHVINTSSIAVPIKDWTTEIPRDLTISSNDEIWRNAEQQPTSHLYIAYSISAGLAFLTALPFVVFLLQSNPRGEKKRKKNKSKFIGNLPMVVKRLQFINIGISAAAITTIDHIFGGYLSLFCVQYLSWTKTGAAMLTSTVFVSTSVGRLGGFLVVQKFKSITLMFISCLACTAGFIGITISAQAQFNTGIWLSSCVIGIPFGIIWPSLLSWVNENLIPIDGKVTAYLLVTSFCGVMVSPVIIGYLMENLSLLWFCYFCLLQAVVLVINVILILMYTGCLRNSNEGQIK